MNTLLASAVRTSAAVGLAAVVACAERLPAGVQASPEPGRSPALFTAVVRYFAARTQVPIRVDPRPLRPEARLNSVTDEDLLAGEAETIRMRTRVLEGDGWAVARAPEDWGCVLSQGVAPGQPAQAAAPDTLRARRDACREKGAYESLVFGLPQPGTDPDHPERWRVRTVRMLPYGYEVVDLFLEHRPSGDWMVVDARVRSGVFS